MMTATRMQVTALKMGAFRPFQTQHPSTSLTMGAFHLLLYWGFEPPASPVYNSYMTFGPHASESDAPAVTCLTPGVA